MATKGYINYRRGYKYQLADDYQLRIKIKPKSNVKLYFITLNTLGDLVVKKGYAWDGPSGPVRDTKKNLRASLVHDALYQLMRNKKLDVEIDREAADQIFKDICIKDGVSKRWASIFYKALRKHGKKAASPKKKKRILRAPKKK